MTERHAQRLRRGLLLVALLGLGLGAVSLRIAAILGGRIDPDLVTTEAASAATTLALVLAVALGAAAAAVGLVWRRGPRPAAPWPARAMLAAAGVLVVLGVTAHLVADGRDAARMAWQAVAAGALLIPPTVALVGWSVADAAWRAANAQRDGSPGPPFPPDRERRWPFVAIALLAIVGVAPPALDVSPERDRSCPIDLECRWMTVQLDQGSDDPRGPTTTLRYDLWRATGTRRGTFVVATGGPGVSGTAAYADIERYFDERLTRSFDIVLFDARGVGGSGYRDCPVASGRYVGELAFDAPGSVIENFVDRCLAEADADPDGLRAYGSDQIAEDIETIRLDLGVERIVLYGESYGTVAAQRYAAAHPDRLEALILDGVLDADQPTDSTWIEATSSFEAVLRRTLQACAEDTGCIEDAEGAWQRMTERLADRTISARYADPDGVMSDWPFGLPEVTDVLTDALYDQTGRMLALRALAAADEGDWVPLARMVYTGGQELGGTTDSVSDFAYYATWCADRVAGATERDAAGFLAEGRRLGLQRSRVGVVYLSAAACHAWPLPARPAPDWPTPGTRLGFPVVVLTADADPITPASHARRVVARFRPVADTYLIRTTAGPHVTFGRGLDCPDDPVIDLLLTDRRPGSTVTCEGWLVDPLVALADGGARLDPLRQRARAFDIELMTHPDYLRWSGGSDLAIGCRHGGRVVVSAHEVVDRIDVDACEISRGEPMDGTGSYRHDGTVELRLRFARGSVEYRVEGADRYTSVATGTVTWDGDFDGRALDGFADAR